MVQGEFKLGDVKNGTLPAVFMIGLLIASLVYSELTKTYNAFRLIGTSNIRLVMKKKTLKSILKFIFHMLRLATIMAAYAKLA